MATLDITQALTAFMQLNGRKPTLFELEDLKQLTVSVFNTGSRGIFVKNWEEFNGKS